MIAKLRDALSNAVDLLEQPAYRDVAGSDDERADYSRTVEQGKIALGKNPELRWVICEDCGGSGEIVYGTHFFGHQEPDEHPELCGACQGTGRECVEVSPVECDDIDGSIPPQ